MTKPKEDIRQIAPKLVEKTEEQIENLEILLNEANKKLDEDRDEEEDYEAEEDWSTE